MSDIITYRYTAPSTLHHTKGQNELFLARFSEVQKDEAPCLFEGRLTDPFITARCLITLSNVVQSSFNLTPAELAKLQDPIVTAGSRKLRFEGFSQCAGVYARVDVLPGGYDGEFPANGTTNVDFNQPMINALSGIQKNEQVKLSVGRKEVVLKKEQEQITERKVPLPVKWIKGLTSVQLYLSEAEPVHSFNRIQALQLFQSIPNGKPKNDYYLVMRGSKPLFSPVDTNNAICIGGVHRLKLLEPLLPHAQALRVFVHPNMQSTTWHLYFGNIRFGLTLSRECWRGFSGEGAALEALAADIPDNLTEQLDKYCYANQAFNPTLMAIQEDIGLQTIDQVSARLSAMGLLGYDVDENEFFYRRLPYKLNRIISLNPRLKGAEKLLAEAKVTIIYQQGNKTEAQVEGSGVTHTVQLNGDQGRCTCTWFSKHRGERGICKHILAVKKSLIQR